MEKAIKISEEAYNKLKKEKERTGVPIKKLISNLIEENIK